MDKGQVAEELANQILISLSTSYGPEYECISNLSQIERMNYLTTISDTILGYLRSKDIQT